MQDLDDLARIDDLGIEGMSCERCVTRVEEALAALPGVDAVEARIGGARVRYFPQVTGLPTFRAVLGRLGYHVAEPAEPRGLRGWLERLGRSHRKTFGSHALDCCRLKSPRRAGRP